jgi:hypothetical protein
MLLKKSAMRERGSRLEVVDDHFHLEAGRRARLEALTPATNATSDSDAM